MAANINDFLSNGLIYGGARPSRFEVICSVPAGIDDSIDPSFGSKLRFTCMAASIPAFNVGTVNVPYFGRYVKLSGDRVWDDWNITVLLDQDYVTRQVFEAWNNAINRLESNIMQPNLDSTNTVTSGTTLSELGYKTTMNIIHYGTDGSIIAQYDIIGAWPAQIGPINLNWGNQNMISSFEVRIPFDDCVPTSGVINPFSQGATSYTSALSADNPAYT